MKLSIIIPVYNSSSTIKQCLESIFKQSIDGMEVIVVDNGSNDNTVELVKKYPVRLIELNHNYGPSFARNKGAFSSNGDVFVFIDSDVVLLDGVIKIIKEEFKNNSVDVLQGVYSLDVDRNVGFYSLAKNYYKVYKIEKIKEEYIVGINSYLFAITRKAFTTVNGFDVLSDGCEDVELSMRLVKRGFKIKINKKIECFHIKKYTFFSLLKTDFRKVYAKASLMYRREKRNITFSLHKKDKVKKEIISLPLTFAILSSIFFSRNLLILSVIMFILLNIPFFRFVHKKEGFFFTLKLLVVYYFELLISFFAFLSQTIVYLGGKINLYPRLLMKILLHLDCFMPEQITFFITSRCNLKCKHCFYWKNINKAKDFELDEFKKVISSIGRFSFASITGGEPFLRDDISEIVRSISLSGVRRISIPTNGFETLKILSKVEEILSVIDVKTNLVVKVSLDGWKEVHNNIRGNDESFERAISTLKGLKDLTSKYKNLKVGILLTYSNLNQDIIEDFYNYVYREIKPDIVGLNYIRGDLIDNSIKKVNFLKYRKIYLKILNDLEKKGIFNRFYSVYKSGVIDAIEFVINKNLYPFTCYAGKLTAVIDSNLDVYPCELLSMKMGNLREFDYDFKKVWLSRESDYIRSYIKEKRCVCHNECNIQAGLFFNPFQLSKLILKTFFKKFREPVCELP